MCDEKKRGAKKLNCLLCDSQFSQSLTWRSLFLLEPDEKVCHPCKKQLQRITGTVCPSCGRPQNTNEKCPDCTEWESRIDRGFLLSRNRSVYLYNEMMKESLARFKFRGDAELLHVFKTDFVSEFSTVYPEKSYVLIPIPLSEERKAERGFNQSELLAKCLDRPIIHSLTRLDNEKQSKKNKAERLLFKRVFDTEINSVEDMDVILIDDLYTTGATLHHAARCLLEKGKAGSVSSFTLIRS
ncbi:double zinc ribbon domain-containing protein [Bacillus atrophaeus]|nr:double zinc ribbon domain-containing protein [Bacillus atrophaeus]